MLDTIQHGHIVVKDGYAVIRNEGDKGHHNEQNESSLESLEDMLASITALGYKRVDLRPFRSGSVSTSRSSSEK